MKVLVYTDAHFSINSSIIHGKVGSLDGRLSHLIESFKWIKEVAENENCNLVVNCGDLVNSTTLRSEEITALSKALSYHATLNEIHVMGNHEILTSDGSINSINFIENFENHKLIIAPKVEEYSGVKFLYLPYGDYKIDELPNADIVFSHIDIFNSDLRFKLQARIEPNDLARKYKLLINGHIHNHGWLVKDKVLNLGALSGQNFSSTAESYIAIVDTENFSCKLIKNPHALRFVKEEYKTLSEVEKFINTLKGEDKRFAVHVSVPIAIAETTREMLDKCKSILSSRVTAIRTVSSDSEEEIVYEEIDKVSDNESGFKALRRYVRTHNENFELDKLMKVIDDLEVNK